MIDKLTNPYHYIRVLFLNYNYWLLDVRNHWLDYVSHNIATTVGEESSKSIISLTRL